jgi:putative aldouronate transport system substrate-binding protein
MALALILALFGACNQSGGTTTPSSSSAATAAPSNAPSGGTEGTDTVPFDPPAELPHPGDNLAIDANGAPKYAMNGAYPSEGYVYELPLSTNTGESFEIYTFMFDVTQLLTETLKDMPYQTALRDLTGVNIDYNLMAFEQIQTQFQIGLASDDLPDLILNAASYYTAGPTKQLVIDKYVANLYDYRAYLPNYLYQIPRFNYDLDLQELFFADPETMVAVYGLYENPSADMGFCVRGDLLDQLGLDPKEVNTYDEIYDMLKRLQTEKGAIHPMQLYWCIESATSVLFGGMNTSLMVGENVMPTLRVDNGKVVYSCSEPVDQKAVNLLAQWNSEDLIDPTWLLGSSDYTYMTPMMNGEAAFVQLNPNIIADLNLSGDLTIPGFRFDPVYPPRETEDFEFKYGKEVKAWRNDYASWSINLKCDNIPLVTSYADWMYSEEGKFFISYGPENVTHEYSDKGEVNLTEFILTASGTLLMVYAASQFTDVGLIDNIRFFAYPQGREMKSMLDYWIVPGYVSKGSMDWPSTAAKPTDEENEEIARLRGDITTFVAENILGFISGDKPMSGWDDYVAQLNSIGLDRLKGIYQRVYEDFVSQHPDYAQKA